LLNIDHLRRQPIGTKMALSAIGMMLVVLGTSVSFVSVQIWSGAIDLGTRTLGEVAGSTVEILRVYDEAAQKASAKDIGLFKREFDGNFSLSEGASGESSNTPTLLNKGVPINGNSKLVDDFTQATGAVATVFVRQGNDFARITTSVKKSDGSRAVGTKLDRNHPAYALMLSGKSFNGRAVLFGKNYATYYEPIVLSGQTIGILFIGTDLTEVLASLTELMRARKPFEAGAVYAVDASPGPENGRIVGLAPSPVDAQSSNANDELLVAFSRRLFDGGAHGSFDAEWTPSQKRDDPGMRRVAYAKSGAWNWVIVSEAPLSQVMASARRNLVMLWAASGLGVFALLIVILWLSRRLVAGPVHALTRSLTRLADGDLSGAFESRSGDELGRLTTDMEAFRAKLLETLSRVRDSAANVALASSQIAAGNQDLSRRTELQASALQQTSATADELSSTVLNNADSARQANQLAQNASEVASHGGEAVEKVVATMQGIAKSSQRIGDIIGVIDGIAFQTNILALNAAIEAARAGGHGRGFAVVASEVRGLARRSAEAAKEIKGLIERSVEQVQQGTALVDKAGKTMDEIVASTRRVSVIVEAISAASSEQSASVQEVGKAVEQMDVATQQNAALVEESAAAAESLKVQAQQLVQAVASFKLSPNEAAGHEALDGWSVLSAQSNLQRIRR